MKFIDEATLIVQSGDGGQGCVSFRREKFVPRGGPDGGDGGKGGDVILVPSLRRRTLYHLKFKSQYKARHGSAGQGSRKTGKNGTALIIEVPPGTLVYDTESADLIADLIEPQKPFVVACGGRGGKGNARFKSATNRAPRHAQPGEPGRIREIRLELKLLADVGLVGLPNAGKSTLISVLSSARPKIAAYPFTTLTPNLGVVETPAGDPFIVADIPGLIEGAHAGAGLGIRFLRHIERTRLLVHLIDASEVDPADPLQGHDIICSELKNYSEPLAAKKRLVVLTKVDLPAAEEGVRHFRAALPEHEILTISAVTGRGTAALVTRLTKMLQQQDAQAAKSPVEPVVP